MCCLPPAPHPPLAHALNPARRGCPQVQTNGSKSPIQAMQGVLQDLGDEVQDIRAKFQEQLNQQQGGGPQY